MLGETKLTSARVYLLSFDYPPRPGGVARLCSEIARELHRSGALDSVLTNQPGWHGRPTGLREVLFSGTRGLQELQALTFLARAQRQPVLCSRWWPEAALVLGSGQPAPAVLAHGAELLVRTGAPDRLRRALRRRVLERARLVIANSNFTAKLVQSVAPRARCLVLPPAVDHERFSPGDRLQARRRLGLPEDTRIITTVGRVQHNKGHGLVLRAMASLAQGERARLLYAIAGTGPATDELRALASELDITNLVRWLGHVPEESLPDVYRAAELHVLLSERTAAAVEGFGMVSLEAQACGVPALGTDSGGIADAIVSGQGGFLVRAGDLEAVASHLSELVQSPEPFGELGARGRERVLKDCTWAHYGHILRENMNEMDLPRSSCP